jgi:hypothetical protein
MSCVGCSVAHALLYIGLDILRLPCLALPNVAGNFVFASVSNRLTFCRIFRQQLLLWLAYLPLVNLIDVICFQDPFDQRLTNLLLRNCFATCKGCHVAYV